MVVLAQAGRIALKAEKIKLDQVSDLYEQLKKSRWSLGQCR